MGDSAEALNAEARMRVDVYAQEHYRGESWRLINVECEPPEARTSDSRIDGYVWLAMIAFQGGETATIRIIRKLGGWSVLPVKVD